MHRILDLERYPLDQPQSPGWTDLVERCRRDLDQEGMFNLEGFMRPEAIARALAQIVPVLDTAAFTHNRAHNVYFRKEIPGLAPDHPALRMFETSNQTICADQIEGSIPVAVYDWPHMAAFLAATMDKPALYPMDDRIACANVMRYSRGQALNWHFDRSEFTTTLLLQAPQAGGVFEYRNALRSEDDPNYEGVARMLRGEDDQVRSMLASAGTLNVFRGKNTAHRVTPVQGPVDRIIAVFSYYERPGVRFSDEERIGFYGRAA
ncbi:2OG-Fe(II) oxygenase [Limibaculum sp. FT325]|uniref:HalD/BesD family halogenase n=1 Tax=Thermohalobaculum sediminis TaxID=2939436 RepID=UPI0020C17C37|nr:2OG-Fe(II) oxygenase [Limibaculum sediminis]MCL5779273.1 2OG-Fe(II) oxygenase [Limibaculum sediminis]